MQDNSTPSSAKYWAIFYKIQGAIIATLTNPSKEELQKTGNQAHKEAKAAYEAL